MSGVNGAFTRIWMIEAGTDTLALHTSVGLYTNLDGKHSRVEVGEGKLGRIAASRTPVKRTDLKTRREWMLPGPGNRGLLHSAVTH